MRTVLAFLRHEWGTRSYGHGRCYKRKTWKVVSHSVKGSAHSFASKNSKTHSFAKFLAVQSQVAMCATVTCHTSWIGTTTTMFHEDSFVQSWPPSWPEILMWGLAGAPMTTHGHAGTPNKREKSNTPLIYPWLRGKSIWKYSKISWSLELVRYRVRGIWPLEYIIMIID